MRTTLSALLIGLILPLGATADSETDEAAYLAAAAAFRAETKRAFEQEDAADVVVYYEWLDSIRVSRPERVKAFSSQSTFLDYLRARPTPRKLLVVILGKGHEYSDSQQLVGSFWKACRNAGFERVVIQQARGNGRSILHE